MTYTGTISAVKANRLFWLGRYAERAYINLHLLRKYYDKTIDGDRTEYEDYFRKLDIETDFQTLSTKFLSQMYDRENYSSIISDIERANDNAIVLREEITSESLSYIQMSRCLMEKSAGGKVENITELQPVTDYLLAFWGSVEERIQNMMILNFLNVGRMVENMDMHIRFDYPFYRVCSSFDNLKKCAASDDSLFDQVLMEKIDGLLKGALYEKHEPEYKNMLLNYLNHLILL